MPENVENTENTKENKEELREYYFFETTTLTIENVSKKTLMTSQEYEYRCQELAKRDILPSVIFEPEEYTLTIGKLSMKIKKFCSATEDGKLFTYYKSVEGQ